jgi:hypothetical protein
LLCQQFAPQVRRSPAPRRINGGHNAPGDRHHVIAHKSNRAAPAQCDAKDLTFRPPELSQKLDQFQRFVAIVEIRGSQSPELGFVQDNDIGQVEKVVIKLDGWCGA